MVVNGSGSPRIGLTTYIEPAHWGAWQETAALLPHAYVSAVERAGGVPLLLPPTPADPKVALGAVDALVLTGGADVDPARYAANPHPETGRPRVERDDWELALCDAALALDIPLLAICRGVQVLNVALGGTLHQHLPDVVGHRGHNPVPGKMGPMTVTVAEGTRLAEILGTRADVLCHHHQAIDRLAEGLVAEAYAPDGIVEAVDVAGRNFAFGVQWHPEDVAGDDRLFIALVEACKLPDQPQI